MSKIAAPDGFLGLDRVARRLVAEEGVASRADALRCVAEYERFFRVAAEEARRGPLVPSRRVDLVWRRHMLDTAAYAEDCRRWAGAYLHRDPGAAAGGYERTLALLRSTDPETWDGPGPASLSAERPGSAAGPGARSDLEREDLSDLAARVRDALRDRPSPAAWALEAGDLLESDPELAIREYRRFLAMLIDGEGRLVPCKLVDEFWRQHILDSRGYARFCDRVAGRPLHYAPDDEEPHGFPEPAFRRTLDLYRSRYGTEPPARIWAHMGDRGSGVGGGSLPEIDRPRPIRVRATIGRGDGGLPGLDLVLAGRGVTPDLWADFLHDLGAVPPISWAEFAADPKNSRRLLGIGLLALLAGGGLAALPWLADPRAIDFAKLASPIGVVRMGLLICIGSRVLPGPISRLSRYVVRCVARPVDETRVGAVLSRYAPRFDACGVRLDRPAGVRWVVVEADSTEDDQRRLQALERLRREEEAHDRVEAEALRKADRDARRRRFGFGLDATAWYRRLPDWVQAILLGLAVGLALALAATLGLAHLPAD